MKMALNVTQFFPTILNLVLLIDIEITSNNIMACWNTSSQRMPNTSYCKNGCYEMAPETSFN
jgi:hypothetical protein